MKLVLFGANGMLGRDLRSAAKQAGLDIRGYDLPEVDITSELAGLEAPAPSDRVVNCAAYTDVDGAEAHAQLAYAVNRDGAGRVAAWCATHGTSLVHISTDYVFDGTARQPYREEDRPCPLNTYGRSKLEGEQAVSAACPNALIVRTQSLYGRHGRHFVGAILERIEQGKTPLRVVNDQTSCPTYTGHLATAILRLLSCGKQGIVHVSSSGFCSWYDFACAIAVHTSPQTDVVPVSSTDIRRPAKRPAFSVLDKSRYNSWTGQQMPSWEEGLKHYLDIMQRH